MRRLVLIIAAIVVTVSRAAAESPRDAAAAVLREERFAHAIWGMLAEEEDGTVLLDHNSRLLMTPASTRKLFAAAFIDDCLPLDAQIETPIFLTGAVRNGVLEGDVVIRGEGDPSLGGRLWEDRDDLFAEVHDALRDRGVRRISGGVVADVSQFDRVTIPPSWKVGNLAQDYSAPVDALAFNENVVGVRVNAEGCSATVTTDPWFVPVSTDLRCGTSENLQFATDETNRVHVTGTLDRSKAHHSVTELPAASNPALYAAQALDAELRLRGVEIAKAPRVSTSPIADGEPVATLDSPFAESLLSTVLKASQNLYAEMLLKRLSRVRPASYADALEQERAFLQAAAGIDPDETSFVDASGLSPDDLATPRAEVQILRHVMAPGRRERFLRLFEHPGGDGTLARRLAGLERRVYAKTGYIAGTTALSGIVVRPDGKLRYFSLIVNHHVGWPSEAREAIDRIVRALAE